MPIGEGEEEEKRGIKCSADRYGDRIRGRDENLRERSRMVPEN